MHTYIYIYISVCLFIYLHAFEIRLISLKQILLGLQLYVNFHSLRHQLNTVARFKPNLAGDVG